MQYFSAPCEVVEEDVGGCGPRLYLTGTKLLSGVWEKLVSEVEEIAPHALDEMDSVAWTVLEHGLRVLAPVAMRERLACLLSVGELADSSSIRMYFRIMRSDGEPVACAYMLMACSDKITGNLVPLPQSLLNLLASRGGFRERMESPSFVERALVLRGAAESLFPDDVRALGSRVASQSARPAPRRRMPSTPLSIPALGDLPVPEGRTAFFFPDVDSYDGRLLCELRTYLPYLADYFEQAEEVARRVFRQSFLPLVDMDAIALHDQRLERCPELAHVGVVLAGVLIAESLEEHGIRPDALIGNGLGELAALAVAGAADLSTALRLAAQRAIAQRAPNGDGETVSAAEQFAAALGGVRFNQPRLPIVSLRTRGLLDASVADRPTSLGTSADPAADLITAAWGAGCEHVIECGPRGLLNQPVRAPAPALRFAPDVREDVRA